MTVLTVDISKKKNVFREILDEFFDSSTIHGVKYIGTRPLHEKLWWLVVFLISIFICIYQILAIYTKWKQNPAIITIDENFTPIAEIPFPAITFCGRFKFNDNQTQFDYSYMFGRTLTEVDGELLDLFEFASNVCLDYQGSILKKVLLKLFANRKSASLIQTVEKMFSVNSSDFLSNCRGIESPGRWPCHRAFVKIVTRYGICITFNMLQKREIMRENVTIFLEDGPSETHGWSPENGYESKNPMLKDDEKRAFPHRTFMVGQKFVAKLKNFGSTPCLSYPRVFVHHPHDFPWDSETVLNYANNNFPEIVVVPEMMKTQLGLKNSVSPDKRNCFFDGERDLIFFKIYSKSNCELECLTNITLDQCKCVQFWMPRFEKTIICGLSKHKCSNYLAFGYLNINIATNSREILEKYDVPYKCNCLERCNSVTYSAKEQQNEKKNFNKNYAEEEEEILPILTGTGVPVSEQHYNGKSKFIDKITAYNISFKIKFEKSLILSFKRIAQYEISDFIANCGGLLGLFMGISLLSFVEIIYFCTFRFIEAILTVKKGRNY